MKWQALKEYVCTKFEFIEHSDVCVGIYLPSVDDRDDEVDFQILLVGGTNISVDLQFQGKSSFRDNFHRVYDLEKDEKTIIDVIQLLMGFALSL